MTLAKGTKLGSYEIPSPLGAGGMEEVYRVRDSKLKRDVAIKVAHFESSGRQQYMVSADANQFLMNTVSDHATGPITVILNWRGLGR